MTHDERDDYDDDPGTGRPSPQAMIRTPAGILSSVALIQLGFSIVSMIATSAVTICSLIDPGAIDDFDLPTGILIVCGSGLLTAMNLFVVRATDRMKSFQGYRAACWAAVLSMVSLPFVYLVFLSFPAGLWALIVLRNPDVRARFDDVGRIASTTSP